jgi:tetratricopeptide (TPR) repeat protein
VRANRWIYALVAPLLGLWSAWPILGNQSCCDDGLLIFNNPFTTDWRQLWVTLKSDYFLSPNGSAIGYWRPATKLGYMVQYRLFGDAKFGYHAFSLALFVLSIVLAYGLMRRVQVPALAAAFAASWYATQPAQAESVGIIASQQDLLCVSGILLCCLAYTLYKEGRGQRYLWLALGAQSLALLSKELGVITVALLAVYELGSAKLSWERVRASRPLAWFLLPPAAYALVRVALGVMPISVVNHRSAFESVAMAAMTTIAMLARAFAPLAFVPYLQTQHIPDSWAPALSWLVPALLVVLLSVYAWLRNPALRMPLALFWASMLPVLAGQSSVHVAFDPEHLVVSDRWLLLPGLAAGWFLALAFRWLLERTRQRTARMLVAGAVLCLLVVQSLWAQAENASLATQRTRLFFLADAYSEAGAPSPAAERMVLNARAMRAEQRHDLETAITTYQALIASDPSDLNAQFSLAVVLERSKRYKEALSPAWIAFHATTLDGRVRFPINDSFYRVRGDKAYLLATILDQVGDSVAARRYFDVAATIDPARARSPGLRAPDAPASN